MKRRTWRPIVDENACYRNNICYYTFTVYIACIWLNAKRLLVHSRYTFFVDFWLGHKSILSTLEDCLYSTEKTAYRFSTGRVSNDRIFIFGWSFPLKVGDYRGENSRVMFSVHRQNRKRSQRGQESKIEVLCVSGGACISSPHTQTQLRAQAANAGARCQNEHRKKPHSVVSKGTMRKRLLLLRLTQKIQKRAKSLLYKPRNSSATDCGWWTEARVSFGERTRGWSIGWKK